MSKVMSLWIVLCFLLLGCTTPNKQSGKDDPSESSKYNRIWELMKSGRFGGGW
jgi:starvation-inducible outer membrane lipoprotein